MAMIAIVGLAVDGGYALVQRRASQNAADFAALAGARIVAIWISGDDNDGNDANVKAAITASNAANGGATITFGAAGPAYVGSDGSILGRVGQGWIPAAAVGVQVSASRSWSPYFLGLFGVNKWTATASATARGGWAAEGPPGGAFPVGVAEAFFNHRQPCAGPVSGQVDDPCYPVMLTPGTLNVPGGFGWLKFGCDGYGLGQVAPANAGGCSTAQTFLQTEIGPPGNSFGCCTQVGQPGSADLIGNLPGNKVSADCSYWVAKGSTVSIAVWDYATGTGTSAYYHIVGFTGFQITGCDGGKDIQGVWRQPFYLGPTTPTPGFAGAALAVQLIK
jgi:hypothetical protein